MKIKAFLMTEEEKKRAIAEVTRGNLALAEKLEVMLNTDDYIELETSVFDDQLEKAQEYFQKVLSIYLRAFACKLLAAIDFDLVARAQGDSRMLGTKAIEGGLEVIDAGLSIAVYGTETEQSPNPDYN